MKAVIITLLIVSLLVNSVISVKDTTDSEFVSTFKPQYIQSGNNTSFPQNGNKVKVHYTGTFQDGTKFDSSLDRNTPFQFNLGSHQVIQCWEQVLSHMSVGEKIKVTCPSNLAYGTRGAGNIIPPNANINFEIELLSFE